MSNIDVTHLDDMANPQVAASYFSASDPIEWLTHRGHLNSGETAAAFMRIVLDAHNKPMLKTANTDCGTCLFVIADLSSEDEEYLKQHNGKTFPVMVTIRERLGDHACHGSKYLVEPQLTLAPLPYNPTDFQLRMLAPKTQVILEGAYRGSFSRCTPDDIIRNRTNLGFYIETDAGLTEVMTHFSADYDQQITFGDGVLECLAKKPMIEGEKIRITAFVTERHTLNSAYNHPHLVKPDAQRQKTYNRLRRTVKILLRQLQGYVLRGQWRQARALFAELRNHELTKDERRLLRHLIEPMPATERPIYMADWKTIAQDLEKAYGINVECLNKEEFLYLAYMAVRGIRVNPKDKKRHVDVSYFFRYTYQEPFTVAENDALLATTIKVRLARLERCPDTHEGSFDDMYLLEQAVRYSDKVNGPQVVQEIITLVNYLLDKQYFNRFSATGDQINSAYRFHGVLNKVFDAIAHARYHNTTSFQAITDELLAQWHNRLTEASATNYELSDLERAQQTRPGAFARRF